MLHIYSTMLHIYSTIIYIEEKVHGGPLDYQIKCEVTKWHELKPKGLC